jgi:hypothetical protein
MPASAHGPVILPHARQPKISRAPRVADPATMTYVKLAANLAF